MRTLGDGSTMVGQRPYSVSAAYAAPHDSTGSIAAGLAVAIWATVAGNVALALSGGTTFIAPVAVGLTILPFSAVRINATGTTATATYTALS